jgi:hypothetical protein
MAYAITNPPICIVPRIGSGPALWLYVSADAHGDVDAAGYFTNGADLGLVAGDFMLVNDTNVPTSTLHQVADTTSIDAATLA